MGKHKQLYNQSSIFEPFRKNGDEASLYMVYKSIMAKYEPQQALFLLKNFCLTSTSYENQRKGLELLYMSSFFNELEELIKINRKSENMENRQWAQIYEILVNRRKSGEKTDPFKILGALDKIEPLSREVELLKIFLRVYCYHNLKQSGKVSSYFDTLNELTRKISDPLMEMFFQERLEDFLMFYHFFRNELILSRRYGYRLLNKPHNTFKHCVAHKNLSLSYVLESYEQAIYHANEGLRIAELHGYTQMRNSIKNNNIPFISGVNGRYEGISTTNPVEQAHLDIAKGNVDRAVAYLETIEKPSHYQEYYLGKALNDRKRLIRAYHGFVREGDYFSAQLPIQEIRRLDSGEKDYFDEDHLA